MKNIETLFNDDDDDNDDDADHDAWTKLSGNLYFEMEKKS